MKNNIDHFIYKKRVNFDEKVLSVLDKKNEEFKKDIFNKINKFYDEIEKIKKQLDSFDHKFLLKYFFKNEEINLEKIRKEDFNKMNEFQIMELFEGFKFYLNGVKNFFKIFLDWDINYLKKISNSVLSLKTLDEDMVWRFDLFNEINNLNSSIQQLLYPFLGSYEKYLKNIFQSKMILLDFTFRDIKDFNLKEIINYKLISNIADIHTNKKNMYHAFNVFTWGDLIKLLKLIKDKELLISIFKNIYGEQKFKNLNNENDIFNIKEKFLKEIEKVKKLRDSVMHFEYLIPHGNENILMDGIKALISLNTEHSNYYPSSFYDCIYNKLLQIISIFLLKWNNKHLNIFFQEHIFNIDVYKN